MFSCFKTLLLSVGIVCIVLIASIGFQNAANPGLVEGVQPAPAGSSIPLQVIPIAESGLVVGQKATFKFSAHYVLNAQRGRAKVTMQTASDKCIWEIASATFAGGSGTVFDSLSLSFDKLPDAREIRFVALLAEEKQSESSTKAVVSLAVAQQVSKIKLFSHPSPCDG